jgi:hypothetical protein
LSVILRGVHLIAVIAFGAALLQTGTLPVEMLGRAVLVSGTLIWLLDLWHRPAHLVEGAGLSMLLKLVLVGAMVVLPALRIPLFWIIVAWSAIFSHAPASFRNARLFKGNDKHP